ncbi:MAG: glycosyl hydrolase family 28 protein [Chitinophagales bacterium]|nr:glycosyl hydrolase family 28 protein [Chitinophagales bacterium]MDW8394580.1 glycosyl hydrolase family 28 protein [Chitinophagales bacterium]
MRVWMSLGFFLAAFAAAGKDFDIRNFGAVAGGMTLNTAAIQATIDAAHQAGGGRVIVPAGVFLTGSIVLKSNVTLHVMAGGVLLGSPLPDQYKKLNRWKALILADGQVNLAITGSGQIDGQGRRVALHLDSLFYSGRLDSSDFNFVKMRPSHYIRPQLIEFVQCRNIVIKNITLRNAACWVQTYDRCVNLVLDSVRVDSDAYWNNDGMAIQDCRNVRITNCHINSADDGICLKSQSPDYLCDSVYVAYCTVRSSASAVKFGTVSHGGFRNVIIEHIRIYDTYRSALALECVDGGVLENIRVDGITATNTGNALFIRLGARTTQRGVGRLRNVVIRNMKVEVPFGRPDQAYEQRGPDLPFFHNTIPSSITGIPGHRVENVILENIEIYYPGRGNPGLAYFPLWRLHQVPEKEAEYPEFSMFGELPAWGLYVRHVAGLTIKNVKLCIAAPDYRPAVVFDDVHGLTLSGVTICGDEKPVRYVLYRSGSAQMDQTGGVLRLP